MKRFIKHALLTQTISILLLLAFLTGCSMNTYESDQSLIEDEEIRASEPLTQPSESFRSEYPNTDYLRSIYTTDTNELLNLLYHKDNKIDSLFTAIEYLYFKVDSLYMDLEYFNGRVTLSSEFEIPRTFTFAGREFNLSNDRIYAKFSEIFNHELRAAHRFIPRSGIYFDLFDSVFSAHGIPTDVRYLAIAESGLNSMATSQVGAGGIWQFMPATARAYNLTINSFIDERRNILKATNAAARYLLDSNRYMLNLDADDWLLAFCAYNAGNAGVARVMREQNATDFFDLIMRVDETNKYVWRAAAIKLIFDNEKEIFGERFEREVSLLESTRREVLSLKGHYQLNDWAQAQGTVLRRIWELNPWINISQRNRSRYSAINEIVLPPGDYEILLPVDSEKDETAVAKIEEKFKDKNAGHFQQHVVQKGDTLYGIARRYGTTITNIRAMNNLRSNTIYPGQRLQLYSSSTSSTAGSGVYIVSRGDSVESIANRLGVSSNHLIARNNLSVSVRNGRRIVIIQPGQRLYY
jgi:membrane-bound lytic murein transglycosylase D